MIKTNRKITLLKVWKYLNWFEAGGKVKTHEGFVEKIITLKIKIIIFALLWEMSECMDGGAEVRELGEKKKYSAYEDTNL